MQILVRDDHLVAVNKPSGLLVHRSLVAADATDFALQRVRALTGRRVYPVHRLDRTRRSHRSSTQRRRQAAQRLHRGAPGPD